MAAKKLILFVCEGNSIRSIIAEAIFNEACKKNYFAKSAGTLPASVIHPDTKKVLKEIDIELKKEKPSPLIFEDVDSAYRLVLLEKNTPNFPVMIPKDIIIQWNIKDPLGGDIERFRKTRDEIFSAVGKLIKELE